MAPLDLHVLGTPPAFVLSQDQTLNKKFKDRSLKVHVMDFEYFFREFDPGSGRTLAACLTHASRAGIYKLIPSG